MEMLDFFRIVGNYCVKLLLGGTGRSKKPVPERDTGRSFMIKVLGPLEESAMLNEMATSCHPKNYDGKYPMWIRVEYTDGEHSPPHAHLYWPEQKPSKNSLITKFLITDNPPRTPSDIKPMKGKPPVPVEIANLIVAWAKDKTKAGTNNWTALRDDWEHLEMTFK
jgi:hypothetical protein